MPRPNIVLFMPDQLRADAVGAFGSPVARTPHLDALAARGVSFTNCFSQHSVCSPSRASILTGWYPHVQGHRTLTHLLKPWEPNLLGLLRSAGYHVAWVGQRGDTFAPGLTEQNTDFHGFLTEPEVLGRRSPYRGDHPFASVFQQGSRGDGLVLDFDEATIRTAEAWLADGPPEPWVLLVALMFPHPPFEVEEPWWSLHDRSAMSPPATPKRGGEPRFMAALRSRLGTDRLEPEHWAEIAATYHGMVSRVDDQLGRVLRAIDAAGAGERTVTAFFTDHGEYLGDFGLVEKWPAGVDDCLVRNPLVLAGAGIAEGGRSEALVEMVDLLPTLCELGEAEVRHTHFGRSLVGLLEDPTRPHREAAFSEGGFTVAEEHLMERATGHYAYKADQQHEDPESVGKVASIRTERWTYVRRLYEDDELYDRAADPREEENLIARADDPDISAVVGALRDRLVDWFLETSDVIPWDPDPRFEPSFLDIAARARRSSAS